MSRDAGPVKGGDSIIAFVDDPTGYKWEIIGSKGKPIPEPIAQVRCSVSCAAVLTPLPFGNRDTNDGSAACGNFFCLLYIAWHGMTHVLGSQHCRYGTTCVIRT